MITFPEGRFSCIVADPPWDIKAGPRSLHDPKEKSRPLQYSTMSVEQIASLPVPYVSSADCHLYLWTINSYIEESYKIAREWGFKPSTMLYWIKKPKGRGLGGSFSICTESILFCRKGNLKSIGRCVRNWWEWPRRKHSQKPEEFQDIVESVSPGPYLELFARRQRIGWTVWGDQA